MKVKKMWRWKLRRRENKKIKRMMVNREERDLKKVIREEKKNDEKVDEGRNEEMRRRKILEGKVKEEEKILKVMMDEKKIIERIENELRKMVKDREGGNLKKIEEEIVMIGINLKRVNVLKRINEKMRNGERIMRKVDIIVVIVKLVEREIDNKRKLKKVEIEEIKLLEWEGEGIEWEFVEIGRKERKEEEGIEVLKENMIEDRLGEILEDIIGDRERELKIVELIEKEDIEKERMELDMRKGINEVEERYGEEGIGRNGKELEFWVVGDNVWEEIEER